MTAWHEQRCLRNTFTVIMRSQVHKAVKNSISVKTGAEFDNARRSAPAPESVAPVTQLFHIAPFIVRLAQTTLSAVSSGAFPARGTSLAA